jgi:O-antigen/teichoic acid export membrane protein
MTKGGFSNLEASISRATSSRFARAVVGTAAANVIATGVGALGSLVLARELGATDRGLLALVVAWPTFAGQIALIGLPQAICYLNARAPVNAHVALSTATALGAAFSGVFGILGAACSDWITDEPEAVAMLRLLFFLLPLATVPVIWIASLQPTRLDLFNLAKLVQPITYFVTIAGMTLATGGLTLDVAALSLVLSLVLQALISGVLTWRFVGRALKPSRNLVAPLLRYGARTVVSTFPYLVNGRLDQLILSVMVPPAVLGNYALAVSISLLSHPVALAFGYVAFPKISATEKDSEKRRVERLAMVGSLVAGTAVLLPIAAASPWLIPTLFGSAFNPAVPLIWILLPGAIFFSCNHVAEDVLRARGQPLAPALAEGAGAVATVLLLLALVPPFGAKGAAVSSVIAYISIGAILTRIRSSNSARAQVEASS